jgi:hypothetical protein
MGDFIVASKAKAAPHRRKDAGLRRYLTTERVLIGGALLFTAVFLIIIVVDGIAKKPPSINVDSVPDNSVTYEIQSREHIAVGDMHPAYNSNPPTGGWHYANPAETGVYTDPLPDETVVHNLEHGQIWISYRDAGDPALDELRTIQSQYPGTVIVTYRPADDTRFAVASWGRLLTLDELDTDQIYAYILRFRNQSPEPLAS